MNANVAAPAPIGVLVIEDDKAFAKYLAMTLSASRQGFFVVETVHRLEDGISRLESSGIDVVLLDLELPGTSGLATLEKLLAVDAGTAIVVLTGTAKAEELAVAAVTRGAEDYIFKGSVGEDVLARALRYAVERNRGKQSLERQTRALAQSNAELEQFATVASHDLQEPLRTITSYLELVTQRLGQGDRDRELAEFIGVVRDAAERSRSMIKDLLQLAHVTTHARPFGAIDANEPLHSAMEHLRGLIGETGASISCDELPTVIADERQLHTVFQNLLDNAMKYRGDAKPVIHVGAERRGADWVFSVSDNGIGIAPAYHDRIFGVFERLHPQHRFGGTGIGLALVRKIVERHGGRAWVESEEGKGATFYFALPRFRPPPEAVAERSARSPRGAVSLPR